MFCLVGVAGFEPTTPCPKAGALTGLRYTPIIMYFLLSFPRRGSGIRTHDPLLPKQVR